MWKKVKLEELIILQNGFAFKSSEYTDAGYFVMRITNVQQGYITKNNPKYTQIDNASKLAKFILSTGDILLSLTGNVGRVGIVNEEHLPAVLNQRVARIVNKDTSLLDTRYLFHFLTSIIFRQQVENFARGAAQDNVSTKDISQITIQVPPLAEQQRIVAKLDAAFAEIDKAIQSTKLKIQNYIDLEGANKSHFFESLTSSLIELEERSKIINGYAFRSSDFQDSKGIPAIKITNVGIRDFVETNDVNLPTNFSAKYNQFRVKAGDIVFALTRAVINGGLKVAVVPKNYEGALLNQRVACVSVNPKLMDSDFLYSYLSSTIVRDYVLSNVNTLMQPNLSIADLKNLPVPDIPIDKQVSCAQRLKAIDIKFKDIRAIGMKKISELDNLKSAILNQELQPSKIA